MTPRIAAYETLLLCEKERQFSNIAVNNGITKHALNGRDRDLYTLLVYGVIEKKLTLDYLIRQYTEKSLTRLDKPVVIILRLSLYQILYCDKIPESAAVSEGVKLASRFAARTKGYINAILRRACREKPSLPDGDESASLAIRYSVSEEICKRIVQQYPTRYHEILAACNHVPALCFQVNTRYGSPANFIRNHQFAAVEMPPLPYAVKMQKKLSLSGVDFLENGEAFVQDAASQLAALVLDPEPDMTVLDVCSCPGGKSFAAANRMLDKAGQDINRVTGSILSCDIHPNKLSLVKKGADRLGYSYIDTLCHDACEVLPNLKNRVSRVICDVPCSGLGVIAKKPEIRYKDPQEMDALPELQYRILEISSQYLTSDGILVYSTCTINQNENEAVVKRFLQENPAFELAPLQTLSNIPWENAIVSTGMITLLPCDFSDGFFIAKIKRK